MHSTLITQNLQLYRISVQHAFEDPEKKAKCGETKVVGGELEQSAGLHLIGQAKFRVLKFVLIK